jgi:hypothetical protein
MENFILNPDIEKRLREGNKLDKAINYNKNIQSLLDIIYDLESKINNGPDGELNFPKNFIMPSAI